MELHFFDEDDEEIDPYFSRENAVNHFAWCLKTVFSELSDASTDQERRQALLDFQDNMNVCPETSEALSEFSLLFSGLTSKVYFPSNDAIFDSLTGIPIGKQGSYIGYELCA